MPASDGVVTEMRIDRKNGQRVRLDLGDGRVVWIGLTLRRGTQWKDVGTFVINAPRSILIDREEVHLRKVAEQGEAGRDDR